MKKALLIILLLLTAALRPAAQERKWLVEVHVSSSTMDRFPMSRLIPLAEQAHSPFWFDTYAEIASTDYSEYGSKVRTTILPTFTVKALHTIPGTPWMEVGIETAWNYAFRDYYGGPSPLHEGEHIIHLLPCCRFYYMQKSDVRLYAEIAIGPRFRKFLETFEGDVQSNTEVSLSIQPVVFGADFGEKWFFSIGCGLGTAWTPAYIGTGFRF